MISPKSITLLTLLSAVTLSARSVQAQKKNIVFVHGLAGYGPDELFGLGYWGTGGKYLDEFPSSEWNVFEASVGPVSSNWDRACELYAQIKGGQVDYGKAHSEKYGHLQTLPKVHPGFVPDWSADNPVHLVGHSMGGQTIRMLEALMREGDRAERRASGDEVSDLFRGGHEGYIRSLTAISAPLDGSTFTLILGDLGLSIIKNVLLGIASLGGLDGESQEFLYDFDLDHFGLERVEGETFKDYYERVFNSPVFSDPDFKDLPTWDLQPDGAAELNMRSQQTYPDTFYFSVVTERTSPGLFPLAHNIHFPDRGMSPLMAIPGALVGKYGGNFGWIDWHENDGLVSTISQICPKLGYSSVYDDCLNSYPGHSSIRPGRWYQIDRELDHLQIVGMALGRSDDPVDVYRTLEERISAAHEKGEELRSQSRTTEVVDESAVDEVSPQDSTVVAVGAGAAAVGLFAGVGATMLVSTMRSKKNKATTTQQELEQFSANTMSSENPLATVENGMA